MKATINTTYYNKAGEIVSSWDEATRVTFHTTCTREQVAAADAQLKAMEREFTQKHDNEVQKKKLHLSGGNVEQNTYYMQTTVFRRVQEDLNERARNIQMLKEDYELTDEEAELMHEKFYNTEDPQTYSAIEFYERLTEFSETLKKARKKRGNKA